MTYKQMVVTIFLAIILSFLQCTATSATVRPKAIVIGASSGMGREIAKRLSKQGYILGLAARRLHLLESLQTELPGTSHLCHLDVTQPNAREQIMKLIQEMGGLDMMIISISAYFDNRESMGDGTSFHPQKGWEEKERTIAVDAQGFIAMADIALEFFMEQNKGHVVGISSTSGLRGNAKSPEYSAAKACISYYMEGKRNYMIQNNINVQITDVVPGFVAVEHSPLGEDPTAYWEITVEEAGEVILQGIREKKTIVYVPARSWLVSILLKHTPDWLYNRYLNWL